MFLQEVGDSTQLFNQASNEVKYCLGLTQLRVTLNSKFRIN